jgi:hypothetical protein
MGGAPQRAFRAPQRTAVDPAFGDVVAEWFGDAGYGARVRHAGLADYRADCRFGSEGERDGAELCSCLRSAARPTASAAGKC